MSTKLEWHKPYKLIKKAALRSEGFTEITDFNCTQGIQHRNSVFLAIELSLGVAREEIKETPSHHSYDLEQSSVRSYLLGPVKERFNHDQNTVNFL